MTSFHPLTRCIAAALAALAFATPACAQPADSRSPLPSTAASEGAGALQLWHTAARDAIARQKPNQQAALRVLAYLARAQHRAAESLAAADNSASDVAWSALFDRTSSETLSALMPAEANDFRRLAAALAQTRRANAAAPAVARAEELADQAVQDTLALATSDGFDAAWSGSPPADVNAWHSLMQPVRPPHLPLLGRMKPLYLAAGDAARPAAPPQVGSAAFNLALAEVRERAGSANPERVARAREWEMTSGALVAGFWDEVAAGLVSRHGLPGREASRAMALTLGATLDANIACHDAKYTYWTPRPSQVDPSIRPIVGLPNHPSYPSNHACDSGAAADVLARLFPTQRVALQAMAREAAESRIDAGIHYRFDMDAGLAIGRAAAEAAFKAPHGALDVAAKR